MPMLTVAEAATMYRIPRSTMFARVQRAGLVSTRGRYPVDQLEALANPNRARPRVDASRL